MGLIKGGSRSLDYYSSDSYSLTGLPKHAREREDNRCSVSCHNAWTSWRACWVQTWWASIPTIICNPPFTKAYLGFVGKEKDYIGNIFSINHP